MKLGSQFKVGAKIQVNTASGWEDAVITQRINGGRATMLQVVFNNGQKYTVRATQGVRIPS